MFSRVRARYRFAPMLQFAPGPAASPLTRFFVGLGLVALGVGLGTQLGPAVRNWRARRLQPRLSAPHRAIDTWANEGGSVAPPAFQKGP